MRLITLLLILAFVPDTAEASPIDLTSGVMTPQNYNPAALVTTANKLIALGPEDGYQSLLALANSPNFKFDFQRDYYVAWLCLLVYEPKPGSALEMPGFGAPDFPILPGRPDGRTWRETPPWSRFPLAIRRDVPLLLVEGYALAGQVLPSSYFIGDCQVHGVFRTHPYPVPTHAEAQAALNELVSSAAWKALPWRESNSPEHAHDQQNWKIAFLQKQVDRVP